jgi:predicted dehydrogenase
LENKEIDGVIIATPDHWHSYIFAKALQAGKAIYVEKPVANSIEECNLMMDLQKNTRVLLQQVYGKQVNVILLERMKY